MIFQEPILDAPKEASIQEYDSRIVNPSVGDLRTQDASANNFSGSRIKWGLEDIRTFQGSKNQWDLEDWRTIEGSRIQEKFEDLRRRNLHVHGTTCQREMHEYGDQNVTNALFVSMENIV